MPLLDHFHEPVSLALKWESLHAGWTTRLADALNDRWLTAPFLAVEQTHRGPRLEIDVATFESPNRTVRASGNGPLVGTLPRTWSPPEPACSAPANFPDSFEVHILEEVGGWHLVAAIELVSPGYKDRPEERQAFVAKCATYLHQGVSVAVVDIITSRRFNLHNDLMRFLNVPPPAPLAETVYLYAASYRPVLREERIEIDIWREECTLGSPLPTMPLRIVNDFFVPVEFEAAYTETCRRRRVI
jgi:hypothetical protein